MVVVVVAVVSFAVSLIKRKGVDERLSRAVVAILIDLRRLLDPFEGRLLLLPQRRHLHAPHADLVVCLGRGVGGHGGLGARLAQADCRLHPGRHPR